MNDLRQLCDQTLVTPKRDLPLRKLPGKFDLNKAVQEQSNLVDISEIQDAAVSGDHLSSSEFDSLEIDEYGALHSQIQTIIEEMVQLEEISC